MKAILCVLIIGILVSVLLFLLLIVENLNMKDEIRSKNKRIENLEHNIDVLLNDDFNKTR